MSRTNGRWGWDPRLVGLLAVVALAASLLLAPPGQAKATGATAPNIVLILSDDQRWDTLWAMPHVRSEIADHGVTFTNAFVVNPSCCPSRSALFFLCSDRQSPITRA